MSISISRQIEIMDHAASKIELIWSEAARLRQHTGTVNHELNILFGGEAQKLSMSRRETLRFYSFRLRSKVLSANQIYGWWYLGTFIDCWTKLPESIKYNDEKLAELPSGHFWKNEDGSASVDRYFIAAENAEKEDISHFAYRAPACLEFL